MRYPITPEFLEELPDPVVRLQRDLEDAVLRDVCRRLRLSGELTEGALHQLRALRDRGLDLSHIEKRVLETGRLTQRELDAAFDRALERNRAYYDHLSRKADLLPSGFSLSALAARLDAVRRQTKGEFRNLTQSLGFLVRVGGQKRFLPIARAYQQVLDDAYVQVASGAFDYNAAVKTAVERLAGSGLRCVDYASGRHSRIDVAARRAVLTGVNQVAAQCSAQAMAELDTDLVEVTAHAGARDTGGGFANHKSWQGRVYSFSGRDKRYPGLAEVCGYGDVAGLCGANCRHSFYPFVEGVSQRTYTERQLADLDPPPFAYQGRTYTAYEATQAQRRLETAIRAQERRWIGLEAAGLEGECQTAAVRLQRLRQEYRHFSAAAGLRVKPARTQVRGWGRAQAARAGRPNLAQASNGMGGGPSPVELVGHIDPTNENIDRVLSQHDEKWMGLDHEEALVVTVDGDVYHAVGGSSYVDTSALGERLEGAVDFHNHPDGRTYYSFSAQDVGYFLQMGQRESRAADRLYRYTMRRTAMTGRATSEEAAAEFEKIRTEAVRELAWNGEIDIDIDEYHETVLRLAKKYHFDYERVMRDAGQ